MIRSNCNHIFLAGLILLGLVAVETFKLESSPHFWWDEGWTAMVARNWVEKGHYGLWLNGKPASPTLSAAFPTTGLVALSFKVLGVGIWQGRLIGVLFMIGNFFLLFFLSRRLFNQKVALLTMVVLCLLPVPYKLHPLGFGRQILAEPQMLFFLLAGYLCLLSALTKPGLYMPLTVLLWGIALITKGQVLPFLMIALFVPLVMTLFKRQWHLGGLFGIALSGSLILSYLLVWLQTILLKGQTLPRIPVKDLYRTIGLVLQPHIRLEALRDCLWYDWLTLLGLSYCLWKWYQKGYDEDARPELNVVRFSVLLFVGGWTIWFVLLSIGYVRYLFPPAFIGSIFVADLLIDLKHSMHFQSLKHRIQSFTPSFSGKRKVLFFLFLLLGVIGASFSIAIPDKLHRFLFDSGEIPLFQAAKFLNKYTPPSALVESYDSGLLFLLDRPIHYPPPDISGEVVKRVYLRIPLTINYDPLSADPDYLVVGPYSRLWKLYDPVLEKKQFRLLHTFGLYDIYERMR